MRGLRTLLVVGLVLGMSGQALAATTSANATATIIAPIEITKVDDLAFGNILAAASAGTVELTPEATPTRTPTTVTLPVTTGTVTAAKFTLTGAAGFAYTFTPPASAATLTRVSGSETMTVTPWSNNLSGNAGTIGTNDTIYVGGTLNVGAAQVPGNYTGSFSVSVAYQ